MYQSGGSSKMRAVSFWIMIWISSIYVMSLFYGPIQFRESFLPKEAVENDSRGKSRRKLILPEDVPVEETVPNHKRGKKRYRRQKAVEYYGGLEKIVRPGADNIPEGLIVKGILLSGANKGPVRVKLELFSKVVDC